MNDEDTQHEHHMIISLGEYISNRLVDDASFVLTIFTLGEAHESNFVTSAPPEQAIASLKSIIKLLEEKGFKTFDGKGNEVQKDMLQ